MKAVGLFGLLSLAVCTFLSFSGAHAASGLSGAKRSVVFVTSTVLRSEDVLHPVVHKGMGPGFVLDTEGHVVVAISTISDTHSIECSIGSEGYWPATLVGRDRETGIGVLQIKAPKRVLSSLKPVSFSMKALGFGEHIFAIGVNPDGSLSVIPGVVSAPVTSVALESRSVEKVVQTTIFVHRGLNGAPAFDKSGRFIGMAATSNEQPPPNVGYLLPARLVRWVAKSIIENGAVVRAYLGAEVVGVDETLSRLLNLPSERGALIVKVAPGSPAQKAGLRGCSKDLRLGNRLYPLGGDLIVAVDRTAIGSDQGLVEVLNEKGPGAKVLISFYRDGKLRRLYVVLGRKQ